MSDNKVAKIKFQDIKGDFFVPSYQRGYKWRPSDVLNMINDIANIQEDYKGDYCLQPVVVTQAKVSNQLILVDGQQRLTTLFLISQVFQIEKQYTITYITRTESTKYLKNIFTTEELPNTCDLHYMREAVKTIQEVDEETKGKFINNLSKVVIIWYVLGNPEEGPKKFDDLNSHKISLTNTELVKALIITSMTKENRGRIANDWNNFEYRLQDDSFYSFICPSYSGYFAKDNRIELIIDIFTGVKVEEKTGKNGDYISFSKIEKQIKDTNPEDVWKKIANVFHLLEAWYQNPFLHNIIGYLVFSEGTDVIIDLYQSCDKRSLREVELYVMNRLRSSLVEKAGGLEKVGQWISGLDYANPNTFSILLLFNLLSTMSLNENINIEDSKSFLDERYIFHDKFHFDYFNHNKWDKEHIHATASEMMTSKDEWIEWICDLDYSEILSDDVVMSSEEREAILIYQNYKVSIEKDTTGKEKERIMQGLEREKFAQMYGLIVRLLEGNVLDDKERRQNSIGNLALLDAKTNRSYKAAPFSTKRRKIISRIKEGAFVPVATQNTFMKLYTEHPGQFYHWTKEGDSMYLNNEKSDCGYAIDAMINTITAIWK